jgi:integrase
LRARARRNVGERSSGGYSRIIFNHIRLIFAHAALRFDLERLPTDRLKPSALGLIARSRQRVLDDREIRALWSATAALGYPFGSYVRVLLLTGGRRSAIAGGRFSEIDLATRTWIIPRERAKCDCEHRVPLTDDLLKLLAELPRFRSGDHVFTTTFGKTSIAGFSKYTARLHRAMRAELGPDLPSFTLHDLRRTFRTRLSEVGVAERVAELCIAHAPRNALVRIYDQHRFEAEIRTAHERWHQRLRGIIEPPPANVVTLAARA